MAEYAGSALYLKFGATVLSSDYRSFNSHEEAGIIDASSGADTYRNKIAILTDANASVELVGQSAGTALWAALAPGTSGTLEWGDEGTATGKPRSYGVAIVKSRDRKVAYDNITVLNADFELNGAVTDTVY